MDPHHSTIRSELFAVRRRNKHTGVANSGVINRNVPALGYGCWGLHVADNETENGNNTVRFLPKFPGFHSFRVRCIYKIYVPIAQRAVNEGGVGEVPPP